jgi:hypothetical protein
MKIILLSLTVYFVLLLTGFSDPFPDSKCVIPKNIGILPVFDGEKWKNTFEYGSVASGSGVCNGLGLKIEADSWHWTSLRAADPPSYRSNWLLFDAFQMWMRCDSPTYFRNMSMFLTHWQPSGSEVSGDGNIVSVHRYAPKQYDITTWTRIRIPLQDLASSTWNLGGVESMLFYAAGLPIQCSVDNIALLDLTPLKIISTEVGINSATVISFNVSKAHDIRSARNLTNYYLVSSGTTSDANYQKHVHPVDAGSSRRILTFNVEDSPVNSNTIYLKFSLPMIHGQSYTLYIGSALLSGSLNPTASKTFSFTYKDDHLVSSFQLNQQGFLPYQPKVAYVNDYFGDLGSAVFVVGSGGSIYSRDRNHETWKKHAVLNGQFTATLRAVAVINEMDAIAVGDQGSILRYDGTHWQRMISGTTSTLRSIKINTKGEGFIVGDGNTILYLSSVFDDTAVWTPFASPPTTTFPQVVGKIFRSVAVFLDNSMIIGGDGLILMYWNQQWFLSLSDDSKQINCVTGAYQRSATGETISFGEKDYHSRSVYGNQVYWPWKQLTMTRSNFPTADTNLSTVSWKGCWNNPFAYGYVAVGTDGTLVFGEYPGLGGHFAVNKKLITKTFHSVDCIHAYDCYAVGEGGAIANGASSNANPEVASGWTEDWKVEVVDEHVNFFGVATVMQGSLRLAPTQREVFLVDANNINNEFMKIPLTIRSMNDIMSGGDIWEADFSSFTIPGNYRLYIKGLGVSYPFVISDDALTLAAWHSCRSFYYQRSGMALTTPFADNRWTRPIDHEFNLTEGGRVIDGAYHWSLTESPLYKGEVTCPLDEGNCPSASLRDVSGGWFDAGDFGKYIMGAASVTWRMLNSYEMHPSNYTDDWNIPESANGIPDIVDETKWELDWFEKMQTEDGGVYNKVAAERWESKLPQVADLGGQSIRYVLEQATGETAIFGAAMAQASRIFQSIDSTIATRYLDRAIRAYRFLKAHPTNLPIGGVVNPPGHVSGAYNDDDDRDNRCWLAAELYRSTCQLHYAKEFEASFNQNLCGIGWNELQQSGVRAQWAYYSADCPNNQTVTHSTVLASIKTNFQRDLDIMVSYAKLNSYPSVSRMDILGAVDGYSQIFPAKDLIMDVAMFPERQQEIELLMRRQVDLSLGANGLSKSFITGLGYNRVQHPLQWSTRTTSNLVNLVDEPAPGFNVFGPSSHLPFTVTSWRIAYSDDNNYPSMYNEDSPFPILRRFVDHPYMAGMTEFGLGTLAPQCSILLYLKNSSFDSINEAMRPTLMPTPVPVMSPTKKPKASAVPTRKPTKKSLLRTDSPTASPTPKKKPPTTPPTSPPTKKKTSPPSFRPTKVPTHAPHKVGKAPTARPTKRKTLSSFLFF